MRFTPKVRRQASRAGSLGSAAEILEIRTLPAATATFANGILDIQGSEASDQIIVFQNGQNLAIDGVTIKGANGATVTPTVKSVTSININARGGNDLIWIESGLKIKTKATGGAGADLFVAGPKAPLTRDSDPLDRLVTAAPGSVWALMEKARNPSGTYSIGRLTLGGVALTDVRIKFSGNRLEFEATANVPKLGTTNLYGTAAGDLSTYSLGSKPGTLTYGKFSLTNASAQLTEKGLSFKGTANLALFGKVNFEGTLPAKGEPQLKATLGNVSVLGGLVTFNKPTLTLTADKVALKVDATVANVGKATFDGYIGFDGSYSLKAVASINVAGFQVNGANLTLGSDEIDAVFTIPIPSLGSVKFGGSFGPNGWSVTGTYPGVVTMGPVVLKNITVKVAVDRVIGDHLTVSALGTIASIDGLVNATATVTIFKDGRTDMKLDVKAITVGDFALGNAIVTVSNNNPQKLLIATLKGYVGFSGGPLINLSGVVDAKGNYSLTGSESLTFGGIKFTNSQFTLTKTNGLSFSSNVSLPGFTGKVTGTATKDGRLRIQGSSGSTVLGNGFAMNAMTLSADLNRPANSYSMQLEGTSSTLIGNIRFSASVAGTGSSWGSPTFRGTGTVGGVLASVVTGTASFTMESNQVRFQGELALKQLAGFRTTVQGTVKSDGTISIGFKNSAGEWVSQQLDKAGKLIKEWLYFDGAGQKLQQFRQWASTGLTNLTRYNQSGVKVVGEFFNSSGKWVSQQFDSAGNILKETISFGAVGTKVYQIRTWLSNGTFTGFTEFNTSGGKIAEQWLNSSNKWISQKLNGAGRVLNEWRYHGKYGSQLYQYVSWKVDGTLTGFGEYSAAGVKQFQKWLNSSGNWISQNLNSAGKVVSEWIYFGGSGSKLKQYASWTSAGKLTALTKYATDGVTKTFEAYISTTGNWVEKTYKNGVATAVKVWNSAGKYLGDELKNFSDAAKKLDPTTTSWWPF